MSLYNKTSATFAVTGLFTVALIMTGCTNNQDEVESINSEEVVEESTEPAPMSAVPADPEGTVDIIEDIEVEEIPEVDEVDFVDETNVDTTESTYDAMDKPVLEAEIDTDDTNL